MSDIEKAKDADKTPERSEKAKAAAKDRYEAWKQANADLIKKQDGGK